MIDPSSTAYYRWLGVISIAVLYNYDNKDDDSNNYYYYYKCSSAVQPARHNRQVGVLAAQRWRSYCLVHSSTSSSIIVVVVVVVAAVLV